MQYRDFVYSWDPMNTLTYYDISLDIGGLSGKMALMALHLYTSCRNNE